MIAHDLPTTEAGRRLLETWFPDGDDGSPVYTGMVFAIRAIEQEARADLAAGLEALPDGVCDLTGARHSDLIERRAVLAAIEEATNG